MALPNNIFHLLSSIFVGHFFNGAKHYYGLLSTKCFSGLFAEKEMVAFSRIFLVLLLIIIWIPFFFMHCIGVNANTLLMTVASTLIANRLAFM